MCDQNHHLIQTVKKLYTKKLPMLECQINLINQQNCQSDENSKSNQKSDHQRDLSSDNSPHTNKEPKAGGVSDHSYSNPSNNISLGSIRTKQSDSLADVVNSEKKKEQDAISSSYNKITKLTYGKNGLITFLDHLFFNINEGDKQKFNYYFALKNQINSIEKQFEQVDAVKAEDEPEYDVVRQPKYTMINSKRPDKIVESSSNKVWDTKMVVSDVKLCAFGNDQSHSRMWMQPREWREFHESLRLTH